MKKHLLITCALFVATLAACSSKPVKEDVYAKAPRMPSGEVDMGLVNSPKEISDSKYVMDGGVYHEGENYADVLNRGGKMGTTIPAERFYIYDREKNAPVDALLYVLTDDDAKRCLPGKFLVVDGHKKLVVYSQSPVPSTYCVYQKKFVPESQGFTISIEKGGVCKPSNTFSTTEGQRKLASVEPVNHIVSMNYCTENTVSYGRQLEKK